ncbi:hypothetical protein [Paracoccus zhejiangensis]|uniref:Uncharacterized protein n=1 Tax=Paracoccus zhejiangensis TaxID=1077935 RepID=A0A2H5F4S5_9RHOB|nr:hypothetical protein [Paracoccus zhejiangensis]AUH66544.1 hypothetical protein CX676_19745 [Paracoccus zhejiangensis]
MAQELARAERFSELKLALVDAICALSEHERDLESRPDKTPGDRADISAFFLLRCRLNDAILTLHAVEAGWRSGDAGSVGRIGAALAEIRAIAPAIQQRGSAQAACRRMIDLIEALPVRPGSGGKR